MDFYLWAKALHVLAVIAWMAGMLMLPRLYAYQTEAEPGGELERKMIEASQRLRTIILNPSMILAWVLGLYMVYELHQRGGTIAGWLWVKLALVFFGTSALHGYIIGQGKKLAKGQRTLPAKTWRLLNELPFIIAIPVVILVIVKPF
jgi:protoporphyrinogen IX oxidase